MNTLGHHTTGDATTAPPVVLLHGLGSGARTWATFQERLSPRRSIALDLPGHGASPHRDEYSCRSMADEVLAFLADVRSFDLVGHSLGGAVAQHIAMRAPDRVRRLVIEDAPPPPLEPLPELPPPPAEPPEPVDFDWATVAPIFREVRTPNADWWAVLPTLTTETLWLAGGPTSHVDQTRIALAAERMPAAKLVEIPVGHHIHREAPADFAAAVLPFLS